MRTRVLNVVLLVVAGLVGGALSNVLLQGGPALAQGGAVAKEIRAERFALVDAAGKERATLTLADGEPGLHFVDSAGRPRAALRLLGGPGVAGEPGLVFLDTAGRRRAVLRLCFGGNEPELQFYDAEAGLPCATLSARDGLWLAEGAVVRAQLGIEEGELGLWLRDAAGQDRVVWGSTETENTRTGATTRFPISTITLFDETGRVSWQAP